MNRYGSILELWESNTVSSLIASNPERVPEYASIMSDLAKTMHTTDAEEKGMNLNGYIDEVYTWIDGGIAYEDEEISKK